MFEHVFILKVCKSMCLYTAVILMLLAITVTCITMSSLCLYHFVTIYCLTWVPTRISIFFCYQNFQFHFHYRVMAKNIIFKTQKPQQFYCPDGLMVKLQAVPNCMNPVWDNFFFFFFSQVFFHCN